MADTEELEVRITHRGIYRGREELKVGEAYKLTPGEQKTFAGKYVAQAAYAASASAQEEVARLKADLVAAQEELAALKAQQEELAALKAPATPKATKKPGA